MPLPVSKPKTFEELLEAEMAKGNAGGIEEHPKPRSKSQQDTSTNGRKKEFLKRKSVYQGLPKGKPKQVLYYTDAFKEEEG